MNFESVTAHFARKWPLYFLGVFLGLLFALARFNPMVLSSNSSVLLIAVTSIYVYLTYEVVRATQSGRPMPNLSVEYLLVENSDSPLIKDKLQDIESSAKYKEFLESESTDPKAQAAVFLKIQNNGATDAINNSFDIVLEQNSLNEKIKIEKPNVKFRDLRKGEQILFLLAVYKKPTKKDSLSIKKLKVTYTDVSGKHNNSKPITENFTKLKTKRSDPDMPVILQE